MIALALALQLLATTAPAAPVADSTPPAPGAPKFAQLGSVTGVPPDSGIRGDFVSSFRGVFAQDELPGERLAAGNEWKAGLPLPNRFRLLEGTPADDAWTIDVVVGAPPPLHTPESAHRSARTIPSRRMSRGMIAAFVIHVPDPAGGAPRTLEARYAFAFPARRTVAGDLAVPSMGYAFPWSEAGRIAGTLALETLHRESGDIVTAERMDIRPAVRTDAGR